MKSILIAFASLAGLAGCALLAAYLVPSRYEGSFIIEVEASPEAVWQVLEAFEAYPSWRSDVASVAPVPGKPLAWRETHARGAATLHEAIPEREPEKFIDRFIAEGPPGDRGVDGGAIADKGERIILLVLDAQGHTRVSITEKGIIEGPWNRLRARFGTGYRAGPHKLGMDLRKRLGE